MNADINGIKLDYQVDGTSGKPWVVLVHGFPFARATWSAQVEALAKDFQVLTYDLRGMGHSELGPAPQPLEAYVDDLFALMDHVGIAKAAVGGLSMGGYIVLRAVQRSAERFWAVALCDTKSEPDSDEGKLGRAAGIKGLHGNGVEAFVQAMLPKLLLRPNEPAGQALLALMLKGQAAGLANALIAMQGRTDTTPGLKGWKLPTLVLVGSGDAITPSKGAEIMAAHIVSAKLQILANAGHVSNLEAPEEFTAALKGFLLRERPAQ